LGERCRANHLAGTAAVCLVMLSDLGRLLGDVQSAGQRSYDAGVFTSFRLRVWETDELVEVARALGQRY
jgi:hypothetical protein